MRESAHEERTVISSRIGYVLCLVPAVLFVAGCGSGDSPVPPDETYDPSNVVGKIDTSLPADQQARQEAINKVFLEIHNGTSFEQLSQFLPDAILQESGEQFMEGKFYLTRWEFKGAPSGNDVPVTVYLSTDDRGEDEAPVDRVYTVTGSRGRWQIKRK
jgi:hypothetical protein